MYAFFLKEKVSCCELAAFLAYSMVGVGEGTQGGHIAHLGHPPLGHPQHWVVDFAMCVVWSAFRR